MNTEFNLKMQAWLDGELPAAEAKVVEARVNAQPDVKALLAELQVIRGALRGNEPEHSLPESPEFYWSKIERAILAAEQASRRPAPFSLAWLLRYWPQLGGAAAAALLMLVVAFQAQWFSRPGWEVIENPLAETSTFSFRSEPDRMTLVWVSDKAEDQEDDSEVPN